VDCRQPHRARLCKTVVLQHRRATWWRRRGLQRRLEHHALDATSFTT